MRYLIVLCGICIFLSSCFEIVEEVNLKADGTGTFSYIINASRSKDEIAAAQKLDSFMGKRIPDKGEVMSQLARISDLLTHSDGISGVQLTQDYTNYIFQIKGSFASLEKLNAAFAETATNLGGDGAMIASVFRYSGADSCFTRKASITDKARSGAWEKLLGTGENTATYTCIVRNEKPAESTGNTLAKISPSRKAVMLKTTVRNAVYLPGSLNLHITYGKPALTGAGK
ncbi:MAG: hypothetical protein JNL57_07645 [Bacteroidetes bacterium]|nr:hypothetical protein [Bacteroidota bacterium]